LSIADILLNTFFFGFAAELKKKSNKPKRPTIKSLFGN
jgi:hypothetical protein